MQFIKIKSKVCEYMNELIINTDNLLYNLNKIREKVSEDNYTIIAVVKGNAYGLGIVELTNFLSKNGITFFAVASVQEAITLRQAGINEKLMILTPFSDKDTVKLLIDNNIILTIDSQYSAQIANEIAKKENKEITAHIKIDTGLSRYGFNYLENDKTSQIIKKCDFINFEGIFSHFSNSLASDSSWSNKQFERFNEAIKNLEEKGIEFKLKHICNSSGFFKYPNMHLNAARIGSAFSGYASGPQSGLKQVSKFHTKTTRIKELNKGDFIGYGNSYIVKKQVKIAILPTGYFDGIGITLEDQRFKFLSKLKKVFLDIKSLFKDNAIFLNINGQKLKVLGQIGMHDVVIDITGTNLKENDDIYFDVRPTFIDTSIKRIYE